MNKKPYKIGVLASTNGTDLQAIIDEMKAGKMPGIELSIVISNKKDAYALERAKNEGVETIFINPKNKSKQEYDEEIANILKKYEVNLVVLIGYMRILTTKFVRQFKNKIINVHPALMPKFSGKGFFGANVYEEVLRSKEKETGCTIHFVDEGVDTGKIILQKKVKIYPEDTVETLKTKIQSLEKKYYPEVIRMLASKTVK